MTPIFFFKIIKRQGIRTLLVAIEAIISDIAFHSTSEGDIIFFIRA